MENSSLKLKFNRLKGRSERAKNRIKKTGIKPQREAKFCEQ